MALSSFVGSFAEPTATGNLPITGMGFQPAVVIFFSNARTADGSGANGNVKCLGIAISSSSRVSQADGDNNALAPAASQDATKCLKHLNAGNTVLTAADFVSMDSDGITLNYTTVDATQRIVNYLALGGADLTNVSLISFSTKTTTGNQGYTGAGFQPDAVLFLSGHTTAAGYAPMLGFAKSATQRGVGFAGYEGSTDSYFRYQRTDKCVAVINTTTANTLFAEADLVSLDADGVTLNYSTANATTRTVYALCFKGGQYAVGNDTQKTSTGTKANTAPGFQPTGLLLTSVNNTASSSIDTTLSKISTGAASSTTARGAIWDESASGGIVEENLDRTKIIKMADGSTPTINAAADLSSFDASGFTPNWTTADATAREFLFMVFGSSPPPSGFVPAGRPLVMVS